MNTDLLALMTLETQRQQALVAGDSVPEWCRVRPSFSNTW